MAGPETPSEQAPRDRPRPVLGGVAAVAVVVAVALTVVVAAPGLFGAESSYVVLSDSMSPAIESGDIVVVQDTAPGAVAEGDVITYRNPDSDASSPPFVTHRVVNVRRTDDGDYRYRTKGDANEDPDPYTVPESAVIGTVWFAVPLVGHLVVFAQSTLGIVIFLIVPGILLAGTEAYSLYRDLTAGEESGKDPDEAAGPDGGGEPEPGTQSGGDARPDDRE